MNSFRNKFVSSIKQILYALGNVLQSMMVQMRAFANWLWGRTSDQDAKMGSKAPPINQAARFGVIIVLIFFGGFGLWAAFAPLESASVASGKIIVATNRKIIQHLEGGIVKQIFVQDGSTVKAGDPLIKLDDTQAKAAYDTLHSQSNELYITEARLVAERDERPKIVFPAVVLQQQNDPKVAALMKAQETVFENNNKTLNGQLEIYQQRIAQLEKEIESYRAQVKSNTNQLEIIEKELKAMRVLDAKGLIEKPRLWALEREAARLEGNRGQLEGSIAETQQKIGETEQQIITLKDTTQKETLKQLTETQRKLADTVEKEKASEDVLRRTVITAPQAGIVVNLQEHTIGGVISPAKPILEIVPSQDALIVEAQISPLDIDVVHPGLVARVRLTPYKQRNVPTLNGTVTQVSADAFQDQQTRQTYYTARITIPAKELQRLQQNITLYPGMPVEVLVVTDKRTFLSYLLTPITDSLRKAFREQ